MFLQLYKSLVRPHLEYASPVWSPYLKKHQIAIENIQRRATKLIKNFSKLSYKERLLQLGLPSLEYRRMHADMLQVYKILNKIDLLSTNDLLITTYCNRTRGHNLKLSKQSSNTELRRNSFSIRVVDSWNNLTHEKVNVPSVNSFKNKLNSFWKHHPSKFEPICYSHGATNSQFNANRRISRSHRLANDPGTVS